MGIRNIGNGKNSVVTGTVGLSDEAVTTVVEGTSSSITTSRHTIRVEDAKSFRIYMDHGDTDQLYWNLSAAGAVTVNDGTLLTRWKDVCFEASSGELMDITVAVSASSGTSTVRVQAVGRTGTTPTITIT